MYLGEQKYETLILIPLNIHFYSPFPINQKPYKEFFLPVIVEESKVNLDLYTKIK